MDVKISDLLAATDIGTLPGPVAGEPERVREAVLRKLKEEQMNTKKRTRRAGRTLLMAAAVAALLCIGAVAYSLSLGGTVDRQEVKPGTGELSDVLGVCTAASPEGQAVSEWDEYRCGLSDADMQPDGSVTDALYYMGAYNAEMSDKLSDIASEHSLRLPGEVEEVEGRDGLYAAVGRDLSLPESSGAVRSFGRVTDTGSFSCSDSFCTENGSAVYDMFVTAKGAMPAPVYFFADTSGFEESRYTAGDGVNVLLGLGDDSAVLFAETEHSFVMVNIRSGRLGADSEGVGSAVTLPDLERFAGSIDFTAIDAAAASGQA